MTVSEIPIVQLNRSRQLVEASLNVQRFLSKCQAQYGNVFEINPARVPPYLVIADPEVVRALYQLPTELVGDFPANSLVEPIFGRESILFQEGDRLRQLRQVITGIFREKRIEEFTDVLYRETKKALLSAHEKGAVEIGEFFSGVFRRSVVYLIFGKEGWPEFEEVAEKVLREMISVRSIFKRERRRDRHVKSAARMKVDALILTEWDRASKGESREVDAILPRLAASGVEIEGMNDGVLCDFIYSAYLACYLPPSSATIWALYEILSSPKLCADIGVGGSKEIFQSVFYETLRFYNPLPYTTRLIKQDCEVGGINVTAGTRILIAACLIHKNEAFWEEANVFKPKRFVESESLLSDPAFIPFGGGFHRCLGIHFAPLLTEACLKAFVDSSDAGSRRFRVCGKANGVFYAATMRPKGPIWLEW